MESEFKIKEMKIKVPEGYEIDKENSTYECIKFKSIKKKLPKTWEEFCETYPKRKGECWIDDCSKIHNIDNSAGLNRKPVEDSNLLPNAKYAKIILALYKLIQLRDCYNDGWQPDWTNSDTKYTIRIVKNKAMKNENEFQSYILTFKSEKLCDEFFNNFKDLIEIAKSLL